jgi:hypothetical protein
METSPGETLHSETCDTCGGALQRDALFCAHCGARRQAPDRCPACSTGLAPDARFCSGCGIRVVGARPASAHPVAEEDPQATLQKEKASLPQRPGSGRGSKLGANVLAFVALLAVLVVVIYVMNKGKPKEATMFSGPAPAASPPAAQMARQQPSAAGRERAPTETPAGEPIGGTVRLAEGVEAPSGGVLFLFARPAGQERGPPLAVQRVPQPSLPMEFRIDSDNVMIPGMAWSGPVDVSARWDADGDAMSKEPSDLEAEPARSVDLGRMDVTLELR